MEVVFETYASPNAPQYAASASAAITPEVEPEGGERRKRREPRNSNPCKACQTAKRRCNLASPKCSRCTRLDLDCHVHNKRWRSFIVGPNRPTPPPSTPSDRPSPAANDLDIAPTGSTPSQPAVLATSASFAEHVEPELLTGAIDSHIDPPVSISAFQPDDAAFWNALPATSAVMQWDQDMPFDEYLNGTNLFDDSNHLPIGGPTLPHDPFVPRASPSSLPTDQQNPGLSNQINTQESHQRRRLWNFYTSRLVNCITAHKSDFRNPLIDYFLPRAMESSSFRSAILYLAFVMETREARTRSTGNPRSAMLETVVDAEAKLAKHLEKEALSDDIFLERDENVSTPPESKDTFRTPQSSINILATLVILCTAYNATGNIESLMVCLEQGLILAKNLWVDRSSDQEFLFLIRWVGYLHMAAMLSPGSYDLKAPDFLSLVGPHDSTAAAGSSIDEIVLLSYADMDPAQDEAENHSRLLERSSLEKVLLELKSTCFGDIVTTTGVSHAIGALYYTIGRLSRLRSSILANCEPAQRTWYWADFEAEVDGLRIRLEEIVRLRKTKKPLFDATVRRLNFLTHGPRNEDLHHVIHLNLYNDALVECAQILVMERIEGIDIDDERVVSCVQRALRFCAAIDPPSHAALLLVLPLHIAGASATTSESRSFVRQRLESLSNNVVANVPTLLKILERKWQVMDGITSSDHVEEFSILD